VSKTLTRTRLDERVPESPLRFLGNGPRRRPVLAIGSFALVMCCMALFLSVYLQAGQRVAVLALAHDVPQGHTIDRADLTVVKIAYSKSLAPVPASEVDRVVGRKAFVPLLSGTLLTANELGRHRGPSQGLAVVGVATKAGQLPAGGVAVGDSVDVILTGSPATLTGGATDGSSPTNSPAAAGPLEIGGVLAPNATVVGVADPNASSPDTIVISVVIPTSMAPLVASASAAGQAALVLVGASS
jgi:hypothetical protein